MDLSELQAETGRLLNDPNHDRWTASVLTDRFNMAQSIVQNYTSAVKRKGTYTATANSSEVEITSSVLDVLMVRITRSNGDKSRLEGITREELDYRYPNWENMDAGQPEVYWFDGTGSLSNAKINLVPKPDAANAVTNGLEVWEVRVPADLSASSDVPFDSSIQMEPYGLSLVHWAVAQCWMDDGTPEALAKAKFHRSGSLERPGEFEKQILRIREDFDAPTDIPSRILWRPQGGRLARRGRISKAYPFSS